MSATDRIFKKRSASTVIPPGTTHVKVILLAIRRDGPYNDGYFDTIDVRLLNVR